MPLNPKVRATVMVELMKVARAAALAAMREKSVELELAPPMEMRVATLERRVLVNVARFVPVEFETTSSS